MKTRLVALFLTSLVLVSCTPYGHWGRYDWWRDNYPDFPSDEEVEQVVEEKKTLQRVVGKAADLQAGDYNPMSGWSLYHSLFQEQGGCAQSVEWSQRQGRRTDNVLGRSFSIYQRLGELQ